ncbi:MAG TPA: hypothetical protein VJJ02_00435 [Candidatus Paceibacterota bacterium]
MSPAAFLSGGEIMTTKKSRQKVTLLPGQRAVLVEKLFGQFVSENLIVRENPREITHYHSYGRLSTFFRALTEGALMGTRCSNSECRHTGIWLPPRVYCPDCWKRMYWIVIDTSDVKVYTHSMTNFPGAGFMLTTPCPLISVVIPEVCTKFMSYLSEFAPGEPYVGMPVKPVFRTKKPTYTILDVSWVPRD